MKNGWTEVALGEVLDPVARFEERDELLHYQFAGTYSYARGIFKGDLKPGSSFNLPKVQRIKSGDFIYCKIMAWEGAFGLAGDDVHDCWMSGAFVAYRPKAGAILPSYLRYWFRAEANWKQVAASSTGTNVRRKSLHPDDFAKFRMLLPPLDEQERIVARLDAIEQRLNRIQKLREESEKESLALTVSLHHALAGKRMIRLGDLLTLDEEKAEVFPDAEYPQVGIRSFGNGMFPKGPTLGSETTYKAFNVMRPGKLVMSQVKGWEGAVAVCPNNLDGWYASPEYRTFAAIPNACNAEYLSFIVLTDWFHKQLLSATRGVGARRERVRPEMLLGLEVPFPEKRQQDGAIKVLHSIHAKRLKAAKTALSKDALMPSLLDRIFNPPNCYEPLQKQASKVFRLGCS